MTLTCAPDARLLVRFLTASMIRVTLERPDSEEPLLELPIARTERPAVTLQVEESQDRLTLRSVS